MKFFTAQLSEGFREKKIKSIKFKMFPYWIIARGVLNK